MVVPSDISVLPRTKPSLVKSALATLPSTISAEPTASVAISAEPTASVAISSESTEFIAKDSCRSTFPVPSNETAWAVASPLALKLRAFCKAVAVPAFPEALPSKSPTKLVDETLVNPVTVVVVVPSDISVLPRTKPSLVKSSLATLPSTISAEATELFAKESSRSTFPVPSNETAWAVASPLALKSRAVSSAVAVEALPFKLPVMTPVTVRFVPVPLVNSNVLASKVPTLISPAITSSAWRSSTSASSAERSDATTSCAPIKSAVMLSRSMSVPSNSMFVTPASTVSSPFARFQKSFAMRAVSSAFNAASKRSSAFCKSEAAAM